MAAERRFIAAAAMLAACARAGIALAAEGDELFRNRVAPVLERRCVQCHQGAEPKGRLSLVTAEAALRGGESGPAIVPGKPDESFLLDMVAGEEPAMPKEGPPLEADELAALRQWIAAGAAWPAGLELTDKRFAGARWWSLEPLVRPPAPEADPAWCRTPIDAFILAKLREQGLAPSPEADRRTLVRRLTYDLHGLPPTPEEIDAFVNDPAPEAYERLVDRLLDAPRYGERWGRHWLDAVHFGETHGYDKDKPRPHAWPYRDYVIAALNADKPYGRFVEEHLAGDALWPGDPQAVVATGFLAAGPWDYVGHVELREGTVDKDITRTNDRDDMLMTAMSTLVSLTAHCARCHDHKFDPIAQRDYYALQAVFAGVDRADRPYDLDPQIEAQRRQLAAAQQHVREQLAALDATMAQEGGEELAAVEQQIGELRPLTAPQDKRPEYGYHSELAPSADVEKWVQVDLGRDVQVAKLVLRPCHDEFAGIGAGFGFPVRFKVEAVAGDAPFDAAVPRLVLADETTIDVPNPGLSPVELALEGAAIRSIRVTATRLALRQEAYIFALAELEALDAEGNNVALGAAVTSLDSIEAPQRWRRTNLTDGIWATAADPAAIERLAAAQRQRQEILERINTPQRAADRERLTREAESLQQQLAALPEGKLVYAAATHFAPQGSFLPTAGTPRPVHLLHRGNVRSPGELMAPAALACLPQLAHHFELADPDNEGSRRAALAHWITDPQNPLTWRSIVNRVWHYHFGRGIVDTPNDFGRMGSLPTHPELLDWLAAEFLARGQSLKALHRLILTSAVYRQSSAGNPQAEAVDADNRFLWRMNRARLDAECVRDATLYVAGRLDVAMGGPSVQQFHFKDDHSPVYDYTRFEVDSPSGRRRSVYRFIVRSVPDPFMDCMDCADPSILTPKRNTTLTALQALALLNNPFMVRQAEHFAQRVSGLAADVPGQIDAAFRLALGREPRAQERAVLVPYAQQHGLANACRVILNSNEFMFVD